MTRRLLLTTPVMHGQDVRTLQQTLMASPFGNFHPGAIDGEYGPNTAAAVYRAKFALGYAKPTRACGDVLVARLKAGPLKLPLSYRIRRRRRRSAAAKRQRFGSAVVRWASSQVGVHESPAGSNHNPYGKQWGEDGVPWCGLFTCSGWKAAGAAISRTQALQWDYVRQLHADADSGRDVYIVNKYNVKPGDAVCLFQDSHVELFVEWVSQQDGTLRTIGGNTSSTAAGSQNNGGEVARRVRYVRDVSAFVRKRL